MILIGELSLWVALLLTAWSAVVSYAGGALGRDDLTESGVRGLYATFLMVALAAVGLWTALLSRDFSLAYVAGHVSQTTPRVYVFTAFWSGQSGATLYWALMLSLFGTVGVMSSRRRGGELVPWAAGTLSAVLFFLVAVTCFQANPFSRLDMTPLDGRAMNPLLENLAAAVHRPVLWLGYVAAAVPFAFAVAALLQERVNDAWLGAVRRWTLASWLLLTIGIVLGMRWAYLEPRDTQPGRWAWSAVENSSLLPWLTIAASLHAMNAQAERPMLRKWIVALVAVTFPLAILAGFMSRGGVTEGEAQAAGASAGTWFSAFFFLAAGIAVYLLGSRLRSLDVSAMTERRANRRRRYGAHIAHAGFVMSLAALVGIGFSRRHDVRLGTGEAYEATDPFGHDWRFVSQGISQFERADHVVAILALDAYRDGKRVGLITSERRTSRDADGNQLFAPSTEAGVHSTAMLDAYVVPSNLRRERGSDIAELQIAFNPLVAWLWAGGLVMALGGLVLMWPEAGRVRVPLDGAAE